MRASPNFKNLKLFSPFLYNVFIYFDTTIYCIRQHSFYISIDYKYNICYSTNQFQLYLLISTGLFYFLGGLATIILQLVQACSISWETLQLSFYIQYRPVLFLKRPYSCHPIISTGLFYFLRGLTAVILHLVQACSISQEALQLSFYIYYRPVLFLRRPCNYHPTISTGLFYFLGDLAAAILHLVQACSISWETL